MTVRQRAIELTMQPNFEGAPVQVFTDPARAKLEVDAMIAIGANGLAKRMANSEAHMSAFMAQFSIASAQDGKVADERVRAEARYGIFSSTWVDVYGSRAQVEEHIMSTSVGNKILEAANVYIATSDAAISKAKEKRRIGTIVRAVAEGMYADYRDPVGLIVGGLHTFSAQVVRSLRVLNASELCTDSREGLVNAGQVLYAHAGLSLAQFNAASLNVDEGMSPILDVHTTRKLPRYENEEWGKLLRPHRGCPALPEFQQNDILENGSAIKLLWQPTSELILKTGMHNVRNT